MHVIEALEWMTSADGQRHEYEPKTIAQLARRAIRRAHVDRHRCMQGQSGHRLAFRFEVSSQSASQRRHEHIVDRATQSSRDRMNLLEDERRAPGYVPDACQR